MLSGEATILFLIVELIKKTQYKKENVIQNRSLLEREWKLNWIDLIMQKDRFKNATDVDKSKLSEKNDWKQASKQSWNLKLISIN